MIYSLRKQYQDQAKCLIQTGSSIDLNDNNDGSDTLPCYKVPISGPDVSMTPEAKNLWGMHLHSE